MKYGVVIKVTEELLRQFVASHITRLDCLAQIMKPLILSNLGNGMLVGMVDVECDAQRDITNDTYLFRLRSGTKLAGFFTMCEGSSYPYTPIVPEGK